MSFEQLPSWFLPAFIVIDLTLIVLIFFYWIKMRRTRAEMEQEQQKSKDYIKESLLTLTRASLQDQCDPSEAALRIGRLLDFYPLAPELEREKLIIKEYESNLQGLKILEERRQLSLQERYKEDRKRFQVEEKFKDVFLQSCQKILKSLES